MSQKAVVSKCMSKCLKSTKSSVVKTQKKAVKKVTPKPKKHISIRHHNTSVKHSSPSALPKREFLVAGVPKLCGSKFHSSTPSGAARKAFNVVCDNHKECHKIIKVIDTQNDKVYPYRVSRISDERDVMIGGVLVHFRYSTKVESLHK
jgi:hypothetical protein